MGFQLRSLLPPTPSMHVSPRRSLVQFALSSWRPASRPAPRKRCKRSDDHLRVSLLQGRNAVVTKPVPNFTRLDSGRPEIAILMGAMLPAREVVAARPWSTSQEATTEHWWADVLADPRARMGRGRRGFYDRDGRQTAQKSHYRLADEPSPAIEVACSKCEWKAGFSRAEVVALYGAECPLPTLLNNLAMPRCSKINIHWDRCGVYYVNPIEGREL